MSKGREMKKRYIYRLHLSQRDTVYIRVSAQPRISAHLAPFLKAEKVNKKRDLLFLPLKLK